MQFFFKINHLTLHFVYSLVPEDGFYQNMFSTDFLILMLKLQWLELVNFGIFITRHENCYFPSTITFFLVKQIVFRNISYYNIVFKLWLHKQYMNINCGPNILRHIFFHYLSKYIIPASTFQYLYELIFHKISAISKSNFHDPGLQNRKFFMLVHNKRQRQVGASCTRLR